MMDAINLAVAVGLLAACIAAALLLRINQRQRATITDQRREIDTMIRDAGGIFDRGYALGWADCEQAWRARPLYQEGYQHALQAQAALACEMEESRRVGELAL